MNFDFSKYEVIVVGAGLSGCVIAEQFANIKHKKVLIVEKRDHIGGNCFDYINEHGIRINKYGAHLFHTNNERVWEYINRFDEWERWEHEVKGSIDNKIIPIPANITTVNMLLNTNLKNEHDMDEWLNKNQVKYNSITNGEEMAKSRVGEQLYEKIFRDYTFKQWNKYPNELRPEVLARIPLRNNFDTRYFNDKYQVLPKYGYTHFFEKLISNDLIDVQLNCDFNNIKDFVKDKVIIYTGPIDHYFNNYEKLEYRSIDFHIEHHLNMNYYQTNSVVNYPQMDVGFTRIVEYKHFLNQKSPHTTIVKEFTCENGEPYYPVLNERNIELYKKYQQLAEDDMKIGNIHFIGRLANYKYFNMDEAILNALEYFDKKFYYINYEI
jgi:UDP-galactopyranose mutase